MVEAVIRTGTIQHHQPAVQSVIGTAKPERVRRSAVGTIFTDEACREQWRDENTPASRIEDIEDKMISSGAQSITM